MGLTAAWFWPSVNSRNDALLAIEEARYVLLRMFFLPPTDLGSFTIGALIALTLLDGVRGTSAYRNLPPLPSPDAEDGARLQDRRG